MPQFRVTYRDSTDEVVEADRLDVEGEAWIVLRRAVPVMGRPRDVVVRRIAAPSVQGVEEVVRGGPAFAVSLVLTAVEGHLRRTADLGSWQVISPVSQVYGKLVVVPDLHSVADAVYDEPTILLAARVSGEEEPPINSVGIISSDAPDVLSPWYRYPTGG